LQIPRRAKCKAVLRGERAAFGDQEAVGGDTECRVVVVRPSIWLDFNDRVNQSVHNQQWAGSDGHGALT
jgi:hypothetical protein